MLFPDPSMVGMAVVMIGGRSSVVMIGGCGSVVMIGGCDYGHGRWV